ncbi:MAG: MlaD family protein [Candidatus Omnitrophica bacterium]|nr:MlaD family protein [Candidatus Omnitrophota bacterium]
MKIGLNPIMLGAFIIGAVVLAIVALLGFGSTNLFQPTGHFVFYLLNSAQGVGNGTAVDLDGVLVGQVDRVRVYYDARARQSFVGVVCQIRRNVLTDIQGHRIQLTDERVLRSLITNGLVARVQTAGIVGAKFVELGFHDPSSLPPPSGIPSSEYPIVPTLPSTFSEVTETIPQILTELRKTDLPGIAQRLKEVLEVTRVQIAELQTNRLTAHISSAAESLDKFITSPELHGAVAHVQSAASGFRGLIADIDAQVAPLGTNINATLGSFNQTSRNLQDFLTLRNQYFGGTFCGRTNTRSDESTRPDRSHHSEPG